MDGDSTSSGGDDMDSRMSTPDPVRGYRLLQQVSERVHPLALAAATQMMRSRNNTELMLLLDRCEDDALKLIICDYLSDMRLAPVEVSKALVDIVLRYSRQSEDTETPAPVIPYRRRRRLSRHESPSRSRDEREVGWCDAPAHRVAEYDADNPRAKDSGHIRCEEERCGPDMCAHCSEARGDHGEGGEAAPHA